MSQKKKIFKEHYEGRYLTLILTDTYSGLLNKKDLRDFKKDIYKILIEIHNSKLRKFERSLRHFDSLLKGSERLYKKLPTSIKVEGINSLLDSEKKITNFIKTYQREELSEDPVRIQKAATKKLEMIKKEIQNKKKEPDKQIELLKLKFVSEQWNKYKTFFNEDHFFQNEVREAIRRHSKINRNADLDIHENFLGLIKARKRIIGILKSRIKKRKTNLLEKIRKSETLLPEMRQYSFVSFFSFILLNSDLFIESKSNSCMIRLDIDKFYKNFFNLFSKSDKDFYNKQKELEFDKKKFLPTLLGVDKLHRLKYLVDKNEEGCLSYKEVQIKKIVDLDLDLKHIKKSRSKSDEPKTTIFVKHQRNILIKLDIGKIIFNLFKELYSSNQEVSVDSQLKKIKKSKNSHRIVKKYNLKVIAPVIIFLTVVLVIAFFYSIPGSIRIQKYDSVKIDYQVWESDEDENYNVLNPILDTTLWITMISITDNYSTGLILGLYNNLLGKELFFESGLLWLNKCIDQDRNGSDDITGNIALTYGNSSDLYFNTPLMIEFKVLGIQKADLPPPNLGLFNMILPIVIGVFVVILIGILIFESFALLVPYRKARKKKLEQFPELKYSVKGNILKYGLLALIIPSIPIIVLYSVNLRVPLSHFDLLIKYYPGTLEIIITLILVLWILTIPLYLFLFKMIKRKRGKKKS